MRLQSIMMPDSAICSEPSLYYHKNDQWVDVNGYFNLFEIEKRKVYTELTSLSLQLYVKGYQSVRLMHDKEVLSESKLDSESLKEYDLEYPYASYDHGVFWFSLKEDPGVSDEERTLSGWFEGNASSVRPVNLAVDICTFKREKYIIQNLQRMIRFLEAGTEAAGHVYVFVVDNGNTLLERDDVKSILKRAEGRISILPNANVGGAGGFTRGMLAAIDQKETFHLSHIVLMDDDTVYDLDLLVRLYGFLSMVKDEWKDIIVGGTLLREDYPTIMQVGMQWYQDFQIHLDHQFYDLSKFENCLAEFMHAAKSSHKMTYPGWWCCCYSMGVVRKDNLPLPVFIHQDDISYGLRNTDKGMVLLNGVSVWHNGADVTFAGSNRYYDLRNMLITEALFEPEKSSFQVLTRIWGSLTSMLISYRYAEAFLVYQGLKDFFRGPEWLIHVDAERLNQKVRGFVRKQFPLRPYQELDETYDVNKGEIAEAMESFNLDKIMRKKASRPFRFGNLIKLISFNGWLLPGDQKVVSVAATDDAFKCFRHKKVVLYEPTSGKACVAGKDYRKMAKFLGIYLKSAGLILGKYKKTAKRFREAAPELSSDKMWRQYLGLTEKEM
jgi:galactofuranosylgalactofuranosylrhamnosyl-N-acetylglucosaminyl-diphospho-decaprenol beta-1,5/1,6-galactofuranosyltransferase